VVLGPGWWCWRGWAGSARPVWRSSTRTGVARKLPRKTRPTLKPLLRHALAVDDAIAALRDYSLVSPPADGMVSVHGLVQALTRAQLPPTEAEAWRRAAAALITASLPADPQLPAGWPAYASLLPHARAALPLTSLPMYQLVRYLGHSGSYAAARDLVRQVLAADQDEYGAEHPDTLADRAEFAYWTGEAGDPAAARDEYAALLRALPTCPPSRPWLRGKQPKLSTRQQRELARMAATGENTIADLAEVFTVSAPPLPHPPAIPGSRRGQVTGSARHLAPPNSLKGSGSAQPARYQ
jgi:hypothetical protein